MISKWGADLSTPWPVEGRGEGAGALWGHLGTVLSNDKRVAHARKLSGRCTRTTSGMSCSAVPRVGNQGADRQDSEINYLPDLAPRVCTAL